MFKSIILSLSCLAGVTRAIQPNSYTRAGSQTAGYYYIYSDVGNTQKQSLNRTGADLINFSSTTIFDYSNNNVPQYRNTGNSGNADNVVYSVVFPNSLTDDTTPLAIYDTTSYKSYFTFTGYAQGDTFLENIYRPSSFGVIESNNYDTLTFYSTFESINVNVVYSCTDSEGVEVLYDNFNMVLGDNHFVSYSTGIDSLSSGQLGVADFDFVSVSFYIFNRGLDNDIAYDTGYADGSQQGYTQGYEAGKDEGTTTGYNAGYNDGYSAGLNGSNSFVDLLFAVMDTPIYYLKSLFSVSVFGTKVYAVVLSMVTCMVVVWVIKKFVL